MLIREAKEETVAEIHRPNTRSNVKVAKLQMFNKNTSKVSGFLIVCKLYIRMRIRDITVEKQI